MKKHIASTFCGLIISAIATTTEAQAIFFNLNNNSSGSATVTIPSPGATYAYSAADQADTGTIWNNVFLPVATLNPAGNIGNPLAASTTGTYTFYSSPLSGFVDSFSNSLASVTLQVTENFAANNNNGVTGVAQTGSPAFESSAWRIQRGENSVSYTISGLTANLTYDLYVYISGNATTQGATNTLAPANVLGANAASVGAAGIGNPVNLFDANTNLVPVGTGWNVLHAQADGSGVLTFTESKYSSGQDFMDGFQIQPITAVPEPSTFALAGLGALGFALKYRRSRR